jgi:outer membrane protein OmpU
MKHTLLATTALVAMTGAAAAELSITATGRIGLTTTEGVAAKGAVTTYGTIKAAARSTFLTLGLHGTDNTAQAHQYNLTDGDFTGIGALDAKYDADDINVIDNMIATAERRLANRGATGLLADTAAERTQITTDIATLKSIRAQAVTVVAAVAKTEDSTEAANRFRISFAGSGETDSGIAYGISGRAEQSDSSLAGSQFISGAFGKISMGDLNGADEVGAGGGVSGVGLTGLGDSNDIAYASKDHNVGYEFSTMGLKFAYSQNTAIKSGSNSAMGVSYSGDMGGATIGFGLGQANIGTSKQNSVSASVSSGGLTLKAIQSTNDNGPAVVYAAGTARHADGATTVYKADVLADAKNDTDQTALSISYAMDAVSVTAYTKTVSTTGTKDMDYSGLGFTYDMGGATLKAGVADQNDVQLMDFGVSFSF